MTKAIDKKQDIAFEEFQLYYESTEKVTDRRIATNRWNYSICTAIAGVEGVLVSWALANPNFLVIAVVSAVVLAVMAILYCSLWIAQIQDFKMLNNAKFDVLNEMAPLMRFSNSANDSRCSYSPFAKEWERLKQRKAVQEMYSINIVALNSSNIEYLIPVAFRILFLLIIIVVIAVCIRNWDVALSSASLKLPLITPTPSAGPIPTP
jgi:uncharacterized membrane protein